ncbi:butyrophilin subfamily 1 member A1-like isoform X1 [Latimeria chalumnae]|uniref:butyrophilin subfamily 1 member A1-like isoform X1 n=1 Tax=Latimeria chalumnae TaxID=7897 RepID=UPI00313C7900
MDKTIKDILYNILSELTRSELKRFKWKLPDIKVKDGYRNIPKGELEEDDKCYLTDLLISYYTDGYAAEVMKTVLDAIHKKDLVVRLNEEVQSFETIMVPGRNISEKADGGHHLWGTEDRALVGSSTEPDGELEELGRTHPELSLTEKHLELDYEVDSGHRVTVTLDPNTAHPQLTLSEDLTAVTLRSTWRKDLPDNPERFDLCSCVLGSEGFTSGRHSWVVDVEKQTLYFLGVAAESANRKGIIDLKPELGYWTVQLGYGGYTAFTDEGETRQKVLKTPKKVLVCVDYEAGKVSFSNADDRSHIYTFTHKFKHKIFPFFYLWTVGAPLRICNL